MGSRRLYLALQVAGHRVRAIADQQAKDALGVTAAQLGMLYVVGSQPGCSQRDLAQHLQVRESGVTQAMARLEALGLIRRERRDGRSLALFLTEAGAKVNEGSRPLGTLLEDRLAEGFTNDELDIVQRFLQTATDRFREPS
ncbi:MAG: MarR family transcriptional regulator [Myxococcota bacterium]